MDQTPTKKGFLYRPQKGIKKYWVKRWALLYPASESTPARLETFDSKDAVSKEGTKSTVQSLVGSFKAVATTQHRSKDWVFELITDEKVAVYAIDSSEELENWLKAFEEVSRVGRPGKSASIVSDLPSNSCDATFEGLQENTLYDSYELLGYSVSIRPTPFSEAVNLQGYYTLQVDSVKLTLIDDKTNRLLYVWPYRYLRRYGRDKTSFSMEAGRKCDSGPGLLVFDTNKGNEIFHNIQNFVNNISGRHCSSPSKSAAAAAAAKPTQHNYPVGLLVENADFMQKLAERKDVSEGKIPGESSSVPTKVTRKYKSIEKKIPSAESQPRPELQQDPLYSEVQEGGTTDGHDNVTPSLWEKTEYSLPEEEQYSLPEDRQYSLPEDRLPTELPESSEYDLLDAQSSGHMYNTALDEPRADRWKDHGRLEDNIHTEHYLKGLCIMEDEDGGSDHEPFQKPIVKPSPTKGKPPPHKPRNLPKIRLASRKHKLNEANREAAPSSSVPDVSNELYDTVGTVAASFSPSAGGAVPDGEDMYDHFVRQNVAHPVPAPRKLVQPSTPQSSEESSELYDHLRRETNVSGGARPSPRQKPANPQDVYDVLDQDARPQGSTSLLRQCSLPEESQYTEAVMEGDDTQDNGAAVEEENAYDVVEFK